MAMNVPAELEKFVSESVPAPKRLMAARGLVPLPPDQMVLVYYFLAQAPEEDVSSTARKSIADLPGNLVRPALQKLSDEAILAFYAEVRTDDDTREAIARHPATSVETLMGIAAQGGRHVQAAIIENQRRMLDAPEITSALLTNPRLEADLRARVIEFRTNFLGMQTEAPAAAEDVEIDEEIEIDESMELIEADDIGMAEAGDFEDEDDFPDELINDFPEEEDHKKSQNLQAMIGGMKTSEKVKLAALGNKAARAYLILDSNRVVCMAVLKSPKLQDPEIEDFVKNRNVDKQVLRQIASTKKWIKDYAIKKHLAENPSSPPDVAMKMLNFLNPKDQKELSKNKNVSNAVRTAAKRIITTREEIERRKKEKK
ncbi:MAG: hypothetical protein KDH09_02795 [Chrysiogenetes bacterium]|nr:hypothetical protein [Chrysiogenetes bacterium]